MKINKGLAVVITLFGFGLISVTVHSGYGYAFNTQCSQTEDPIYSETRLGLEEIFSSDKAPAEEITQIKSFLSSELNKHPEAYKMIASAAVGTLAKFALTNPKGWIDKDFFSGSAAIGTSIRKFGEREGIGKKEVTRLLNRLAIGAKTICKDMFGESIFAGLYSTSYENKNLTTSSIDSIDSVNSVGSTWNSLPPNYFNNSRPFPTPSPASAGGIK